MNNKAQIKDYYSTYREVILIDHNKINVKQSFLNRYVTEIIDHHNDSENDTIYKNLRKKFLIYPLGSCSTLIILENLMFLEEILINENTKKTEAEIFFKNSFKDFIFFVSAILIDTRNFLDSDYNVRWTNLDVLAYNKIIELNQKFYFNKKTNVLNVNENEFNNLERKNTAAAKLYEDLINSKYDLEANLNLGIKKLMNKDKKDFYYKEINSTSVIWSSLQVPLESIIEKFNLDNLKKEVNEALDNKNLYVFNYRQKEENTTYTFVAVFINFLIENNKESCLKSFCENFGGYLRSELKDDFFSIEISWNCFCLVKLNETITRKNFEPFLSKFLK